MKFAAQRTLYFTLALMAWAPALADEFADVSKLAKAGKVADALAKTNEYLSKHPADAQMRFMKGVLLSEQNKSEEAIAVFTKLTEDYKDLPEPYNNLAVLYAANGQYDKARVALEKAIRTNPSYQTAYENLGDIYGKMASQAYDKALALGTATPPPGKSRLTMLRSFSTSTGPTVSAPPMTAAAAPAPAPAPVIAKPAPAPLPAPATAKIAAAPTPAPLPVPTPVKVAPAAPAPVLAAATPKAVPAQMPVSAPAPTPPAPVAVAAAPLKPAPAPKPDTSERDAVLAQVHAWAKAWAAQNVDSYLAYYGPQFEPPKGLSRKAWAEERRARIEGKGRIQVEVASPEVTVNGSTARVTFRQTYESDRLTARSRKTLVMVKNGGKWQIKQEISN
ncbi:ketosteroid isomerase-like protein [Duganella sp. 1224]|uniref:nuclear transport factor 2 family protein n=1 Tax=Duganella sp. 1224 TaxID=2587052 RepID=UPI0015CE2F42|nr:nuclear transport factor 2 family protein [Duganella sp. 1224]NYE63340.1 ketosteroid isomerase-like protein [Duganella sp. 1224]